jgi:uncharacterized protein DUF2613
MKAHGKDRGSVTLGVVAPVVAAVVGGVVALLAAVQIVNMAPSNSESGAATTQLTGSVDYGDR